MFQCFICPNRETKNNATLFMKGLLGNLSILWPLWIFALKLSQALISSNFVPVTITIPLKHLHQLTMEFSKESENPYNTFSGSDTILLFWISELIDMQNELKWHPTFAFMNFWWQNDTKIHMWEAKIKMLWYICTFVW